MKLQEHIRKVLREETEIPLFAKRRFSPEDLEWLANDVKEMIDDGESLDTAIYDGVRDFIKSRKFSDIDEFGPEAAYWESYLKYERPLVGYVKNKLNIQESVLQEEINSTMKRIFRRTEPDSMDKIFEYGFEIMTKRYLQNKHNWHKMNLDKFKSGIVSYVIVDLCTKYSDICYGGKDFYDQTWEFLLNHYSDLMEERWMGINSGKFD